MIIGNLAKDEKKENLYEAEPQRSICRYISTFTQLNLHSVSNFISVNMQMYGMSGELLGPIGVSKDNDLPGWKKDILSKPSVSIRKGLAWVRGLVF